METLSEEKMLIEENIANTKTVHKAWDFNHTDSLSSTEKLV